MTSQVRSITAQTNVSVNSIPGRLAQRVSQADGVINVAVGLGLLLDAPLVAGWLGISTLAVQIVSVVWIFVGADLFYLATARLSTRLVQAYGVLNLALVVGSAIVLAVAWNNIASEGRWLIALLADAALVLGLVELVALRRNR